MQLAPPITIGRNEIDEIVSILRKTFLEANEFLKQLIVEEEAKEALRKKVEAELAAQTPPAPQRNIKKII